MRADDRAFTLIEVLVALAIISIGMLAVIQAVGQTANNAAYLRDKTFAHWVAMNQLTLMRINPTLPNKGTSSGDVDLGGRQWRWSAEVTQTPVDSMLRIDVSVRLADSDEDSQLASVSGFVGAKVAKPGTLVLPPYSIVGTASSAGIPPPGQPTLPTQPTVPPITAPGDPGKGPQQQPLIR